MTEIVEEIKNEDLQRTIMRQQMKLLKEKQERQKHSHSLNSNPIIQSRHLDKSPLAANSVKNRKRSQKEVASPTNDYQAMGIAPRRLSYVS